MPSSSNGKGTVDESQHRTHNNNTEQQQQRRALDGSDAPLDAFDLGLARLRKGAAVGAPLRV